MSLEVSPISRVGIIGNPWYRFFFARLAAKLKRQHGSEVSVYVPTDGAVSLFRSVDSKHAFSSISVVPNTVTLGLPQVSDAGLTLNKARAFESKYDIRLNYLISTDRLYGLGYALGGYRHPRSRQSEVASYLQTLEVYNRLFEEWELIFEKDKLTMIMEASPLQAVMARHFGALVRSPTPSRYNNLYHWTTDEYGFSDPVRKEFETGNNRPSSAAVVGSPFQGELFNKEAEQRFRLLGVAKEVVVQTRNHLMWKISGYHKGKLYKYSDQVALAFRRRRDFKKISGRRLARISDLAGQPYVFYALHVEPELWFQARSPEYTYQLAAIASLSRDLPAGTLLAVKEHLPGVGRRPDLFYDQIAAFKNVRLVDVRESGLDLVKGSRAVATICGTVGQEAAVLGKPVISLGRHNLYNVVPHVRTVFREEDLRPALDLVLSDNHDQARAAADGARFLASIESASFDMETFTYKNPAAFSEKAVDAACNQLLASADLANSSA